MTAHVAEAGEARGRVVIQFCTAHPHPVALEAALRVAQAFQSGIESLFVEDRQLIELASFPFAREISLTGRKSRTITCSDIEEELRFAYAALQRRMAKLARAADIPVRQRVVRDEPVAALAATCAECGPWNVVALAEPFGSLGSEPLRRLLEAVVDATGLVVVGPKAKRTTGPVIAAVEDLDRLPSMLRAADRLAGVLGSPIVVMLIADDADRLHWIEGQARLILGERSDIRLIVADVTRGDGAALAETLRRLKGGFIIGQYGGLVVPGEGDLRPLAAALECPLFLIR